MAIRLNKTDKIMEIQELKNGQIQVKHENLTLTQTNVNGFKMNDCEIDMGDYFLIVKNSDERFKPLFVALHNHKNNKKIQVFVCSIT